MEWKLCVVVVHWRHKEVLCQSLACLRAQTFQDFILIVVNNGEDALEDIFESWPSERLIYIKNTRNLGYAAANNQALPWIRKTEWALLLNPDTSMAPNLLEHWWQEVLKHPQYAGFSPVLFSDPSHQRLDGLGDEYHCSGLPSRIGFGWSSKNIPSDVQEIFSPSGAAAWLRSEVFVALGGFDEDFFCYAEDVDFGFRARLLGYRFALLPSIHMVHWGSATVGRRSYPYVYYGQRNMVWVFFKNMPFPLMVLFFPLHVMLNGLGILAYIARGRWRWVLASKKDAILGLFKVFKKRKNIQKERTLAWWRVLFFLNLGLWPRRALKTLWS